MDTNQRERFQALEAARRATVERLAFDEEDGEAPRTKRRTQYFYVLEDITIAAREYAEKNNIDVDEFEYEWLSKSTDIVSQIRWSVIGYSEPSMENEVNFWVHSKDVLRKIKENDFKNVARSEIEASVGDYLNLPFRSKSVDRLLADILVAMELYAFGDEMLNEIAIPYIYQPRSPLKQKFVLWSYLSGQAIQAFVLLGGAVLTWKVREAGYIGDNTSLVISLILIGLFILLFAIATILLPFAIRHQLKQRKKVVKLLADMSAVYSEMDTNGPISAKHLIDRLQETRKEGVIWPAPLFALLHDVNERSGRL